MKIQVVIANISHGCYDACNSSKLYIYKAQVKLNDFVGADEKLKVIIN